MALRMWQVPNLGTYTNCNAIFGSIVLQIWQVDILSTRITVPAVQTVNTELTEEQKEENRRNVLQDLDDLFG